MRRGFWYGVLLGVLASAAALLVVAPRVGRRQAAANGAGAARMRPFTVPAVRRPAARAAVARRPGR